MEQVLSSVNNFFEFIVPISDFMWNFPTNFEWYAKIPILGNFAFSILLLVGTGIYFSFRTKFVQVRRFKTGIKTILKKKIGDTGVSPFAAFLLSSAMRIGPGNIIGVTYAVSVGGPGAIFWMWVSAFFGMSIAFSEAVLAQLFKEKKNKEFVGGLPFYGRKIFGNRYWVGGLLSTIFIIYALFNLPGQTFNLYTSLGAVAENLTGQTYDRQSVLYYIIGVIIIISVALTVFGGIRGVTRVTDKLVPVMAIIYATIVIIIIGINFKLIPYFFVSVFKGAFTPEAIFGGGFGMCLAQGVKRGLMSNEAGQGTITMAASISENEHPCEQGFIQAIGVFLDTMIICTMTGFLIVMASVWNGDAGVVWEVIKESKITVYNASVAHLVPGVGLDNIVNAILSLCYAMFAFTTLIGLVLFAEISANCITRDNKFIMVIRGLGAVLFVPFGVLSVLAGLELGNVWYISDMVNIMVVYSNVPILIVGRNIILKTLKHYEDTGGKRFVSKDIGIETEYWK
ncbi:alanine/glycine:cation symporter family protein [Romboutsia lituseburensis]|uniref:alanine/glycine:cation symporter family protein n=1 Tax=Romboutsia lituseburensis TaxID=1537 RepID=UPI00215A2BD2|nr:alanine:cation symporter family protein [Romboutsia lituseburensis]MCR8744009.1 alanine:cation symporter family protein [Romboutsia lituseburensis]